jgi:hypothetical protein
MRIFIYEKGQTAQIVFFLDLEDELAKLNARLNN